METKIQSSNIKCGGCVSSITKALIQIAGIKAVNVDIPSNEITIEYDQSVDMSLVKQKLKEIGFPEKRVGIQ
ncbi:MAG TPA: heavy metal-associated domain-containing protein [Bacteroidia bacterium]|nr:heavy-metal-associated domain-containing protein [Bacteroidia bacterium]HRD39874.1 heavy metal-associated domain-containing protein [Bacteroidia bacterium]